MLRDAAVDILLGRLGNRKSDTLKQAIIDEMVFAQENLLEGGVDLPWFLLSENATNSTQVNEERFPLPLDFLLEWEDGGLYLQNDDGTETLLYREDWDVIKSQASLVGAGKPTYYDIVGLYYLLRKVPDAVYAIKQRYYQKGVSLAGAYGDAANIENVWLKDASDWLIAETGILVATQRLQSDKMAQMFFLQATAAKKRVMYKNIALQESNKTRQMGA